MMVAVRDVRAGEQATVGPDPRRPHGAGLAPLRLPHLLELCEAAAPSGKEATAASTAAAVAELIAAVEDVFSSAGAWAWR